MVARAVTIRVVTTSPQHIRDVLGRHGLRPRRALGQNFVADANTVRRIARLAELGPDSRVVEIGAGLGALTLALAETGASVTAVEVDARLVPVLRDAMQSTAVRIVEADALTLDWSALLDDVLAGATRPEATLVANLPYNVAVPVLTRVLDEAPAVTAMLVMVQREVGERLVAVPGTKAYGAVSVKVAYHAEARIVGRVPASVFVPRPKVESVLVRIDRRGAPAVDPAEVPAAHLFALVRAGFAHRRKMLRGALAGLVTAEAFESAGIDSAARAESLTLEAWGRLARCTIPSR
jgi:16S rRNA (adenine1518-N6/adenine1519-N6)-dimethyltransferase